MLHRPLWTYYTKKDWLISVAVVILFAIMVPFLVREGPPHVVGKWTSIDVPGAHWDHPTMVEFRPDGTGVVIVGTPRGRISRNVTYEIHGNMLTVRIAGTHDSLGDNNPLVPDETSTESVHEFKVGGGVLSISDDTAGTTNYELRLER